MKMFLSAIGRFFKRLGYSIAKFLVWTVREMKKVRWPSKQKMKEHSCIVLTVIALFGLYIILDDWIVAQILKLIKY